MRNEHFKTLINLLKSNRISKNEVEAILNLLMSWDQDSGVFMFAKKGGLELQQELLLIKKEKLNNEPSWLCNLDA